MSDWGPRTYGDPCRECGFRWDADLATAEGIVAGAPARLDEVLRAARGDERHPDLEWSVTAYVLHVGDNLRVFAERIGGISLGGSPVVASYDENALAAARVYAGITLPAARWSLERSVRDWLDAVRDAPPDLVMEHPERGPIDLVDIVRSNAHDTAHHEWDIARILSGAGEAVIAETRR